MTDQNEVTMTIRIPTELRDAFTVACKQNDVTKSQVVREFVRVYLKTHSAPRFNL